MNDISQLQPDPGKALNPHTGKPPAPDQGMLAAYCNLTMPRILLLGLISGFPWVVIASMMSLWLKAEGLSRTGIGLFGIVFTVYAFNMFWAPVVDSFRLPLLHRLGQRRSWIVLCQSAIVVLMVLLSFQQPEEHLVTVSVLTFLVALASATQDVAVDALRIELVDRDRPNMVGAGSAMATSGWWIGYGAMGAIGLTVAEVYEMSYGIEDYWNAAYLTMAAVPVIATAALLLFIKEPESSERLAEQEQDRGRFSAGLSQVRSPMQVLLGKGSMLAVVVGALLLGLFSYPYVKGSVGGEDTLAIVKFIVIWGVTFAALWALCLVALTVARATGGGGGASLKPQQSLVARFYSVWYLPVSSFVRNYGVRVGLLIIALVFLFKIGEAFLGRMSIIFYKEVGFSKSDIALYSKGYGTLALCAFAVIGSLINARYGLFRGLLIGGIAMATTNLLFAALAVYPEKWLFATAVVTDQFTTAMSTVALVAFLSQLCDRAYTATQYAALASLGNFSRTTLAAASGAVVDGLGGNWSVFFVLTTLMVIPSLALLIYIRDDIKGVMAGQTTKVL